MMTARDRIEEVLESIRPAIQADGGDVELLQVDESAGLVKVRLIGACETCPISMMTLKEGIETRVKRAVPGIVEVTAV
jgi:Fe-S cluster biogenesis protein NfuA